MRMKNFTLALLSGLVLSFSAFAATEAMQPASSTPTTVAPATSSKEMPSQVKVNVNKASAKELMKVKGMNARRARAIVAYRKKHGDFKDLSEVAKVHGFQHLKPAKKQAILDQLSLE